MVSIMQFLCVCGLLQQLQRQQRLAASRKPRPCLCFVEQRGHAAVCLQRALLLWQANVFSSAWRVRGLHVTSWRRCCELAFLGGGDDRVWRLARGSPKPFIWAEETGFCRWLGARGQNSHLSVRGHLRIARRQWLAGAACERPISRFLGGVFETANLEVNLLPAVAGSSAREEAAC